MFQTQRASGVKHGVSRGTVARVSIAAIAAPAGGRIVVVCLRDIEAGGERAREREKTQKRDKRISERDCNTQPRNTHAAHGKHHPSNESAAGIAQSRRARGKSARQVGVEFVEIIASPCLLTTKRTYAAATARQAAVADSDGKRLSYAVRRVARPGICCCGRSRQNRYPQPALSVGGRACLSGPRRRCVCRAACRFPRLQTLALRSVEELVATRLFFAPPGCRLRFAAAGDVGAAARAARLAAG